MGTGTTADAAEGAPKEALESASSMSSQPPMPGDAPSEQTLGARQVTHLVSDGQDGTTSAARDALSVHPPCSASRQHNRTDRHPANSSYLGLHHNAYHRHCSAYCRTANELARSKSRIQSF